MEKHRRDRQARGGDDGGGDRHDWLGAFDFPPEATTFNGTLFAAIGATSILAMYNYGGYNQICFIGGEVRNPERNIPRSILIAIFIVASLYIVMTIVILGMIPWQEVRESRTIASL